MQMERERDNGLDVRGQQLRCPYATHRQATPVRRQASRELHLLPPVALTLSAAVMLHSHSESASLLGLCRYVYFKLHHYSE